MTVAANENTKLYIRYILKPEPLSLSRLNSTFPYGLDFDNTDLREHPERYRVGKGEQGVLLVEPYKSEILPHWRFATPEVARESSEKIFGLFENYLLRTTGSRATLWARIWHASFSRWANALER